MANSAADDPTRRVADLWGDADRTRLLEKAQWMAAPEVLLHLNRRATGDSSLDWLAGWAVRFFVGHHLRVLVLGCGEGWLERALAPVPFIERIDAFDVAGGAVERARETAEKQGLAKIHYGVLDLNVDPLAENAYDIVIAHSILHHVENLEHAFAQIERSLKADGTLIVNEYVGPKRFQISDQQLRAMNRVLVALPPELRRGAIEQRTYEAKERPTVEHMLQTDPSEAVRADELPAFLERHFEILDWRDLGGTLLQHLLYDIVQNFDFSDPRRRSTLELICLIESALVDGRALPSDYAIVAGRRKSARLPLTRYRRQPLRRPAGRSLIETDPLGGGSLRVPDPSAGFRLEWLRLRGMLRESWPEGNEIALMGSWNPLAVAEFSGVFGSGDCPDRSLGPRIVIAAPGLPVEDVVRAAVAGSYVVRLEPNADGVTADLPFNVLADALRVLLLSRVSSRRIHIGRSRWREVVEQIRYGRWRRSHAQFRPLPPAVWRSQAFLRIGASPVTTAPFEYLLARWSVDETQPGEAELLELLLAFERIAFDARLVAAPSTWTLYQRAAVPSDP
jgi:SAM-dependent methyltransferase